MASAAQIIAAYYPAAASFAEDIVGVAAQIGASPFALADLINFESNFSTSIRNKSSGATGLIQFMPKTAMRLGTTTDALAAMSAKTQMQWVLKYFQPYAGKVSNPLDLYMAVFYPKAIGNHSMVFPADVIAQNSGISTPSAYAAKVIAKSKLPKGLALPDSTEIAVSGSSISSVSTGTWVAWTIIGIAGAFGIARALGFRPWR